MTKASDLYALALAMIELMYPMSTNMERDPFLMSIKSTKDFPDQGRVSRFCISQLEVMLSDDPKCRTDAKSIVSILLLLRLCFYR